MKFKKITSLLLAVLIAISALPLGGVTLPDLGIKAAAATIVDSGTCGANGDNVTWTLDSDGTLTISGDGEMESYNYPDNVPWKTLNITAAVIENGVTSIGDYTFRGCSSLTSVTIPDSVTNIGWSAFSGCAGLTKITIPDGVTSIGGYVFYGCSSLTSIIIPDGVTSIGELSFKDCCSLTSVTIPDSVTSIGYSAFCGCSSLTNITIPDGVTSIGSGAFYGCSSLTSITIPDGVTSIGNTAFYGCSSLTNITIPDGVTSIGDSAFFRCTGLTSITIPDGVTSIGDSAFSGCTGFTGITVPVGVTSIGGYAFYDVANVEYSGSADGSPWGARNVNGYVENGLVYRNSKKTELTACSSSITGEVIIPDSVTAIGNNAFYGSTGITSITVPDSVTSIGSGAFYNVANISYNGSVTGWWGERTLNGYIEAGLVYRNSEKTELTACPSTRTEKVIIPDGVTSIGSHAFENCTGLTSITIPSGVTKIGYDAFYGCRSLASITIPDSVSSIGGSAFHGCSNLTSITIPDGVTKIGQEAFYGCRSLTSIIIPAGVTSIGRYAFDGCTVLTNITIPDGVTEIGEGAFYDCNSLTSITIPDGVTEIGEDTFNGCSSLTNIIIPDGVTSIGNYAFEGCICLTSITIPDGATEIGEGAFYGCSSLTNITIPDGVTSIGNYAFEDCICLTSITIPDGVTEIGEGAFNGCSSLTNITIPDGVTSIGNSTFSGCRSLTSITIPDGVTSIGNYAFVRCSSLTDIYFYNPNCEIFDDYFTIDVNAVIYGYADSTAQEYAEKYNRTFVLLGHDEHNFTSSITKQATCTQDGEVTYTCTNKYCGYSYTEVLPSTGHTPVIDATVAATCTSTGLTEGKHCSTCNEVLATQKIIPATGHDFGDWTVKEDSTCTKEGISERKCAACEYTETKAIAKKAHTESEWITVTVATCTDAGKRVKKCTVCETVLESETISALGHTPVIDAAVAATCTSTGLTEGKHCSTCNEVLAAQKIIPAIGHNFGGWVVKEDSTCTKEGVGERKCAACEYTETKAIAKKAHTESDWITVTVATCTDAGKRIKKCTVCETVLESETISALGHTPVIDAAVAATCTSTGLTEGKHCSTCNEVLATQKIIPATGHDFGDWTVKEDSTCTKEGISERKCAACEYTETKAIAKKAHTESEWITVTVATCTDAGKRIKKCTVCETVLKSETISALGHTPVIDAAVAATCTTTGLTEGKHCSTCNEVLAAQKIIPATGHNFGGWVVKEDSTCTKEGISERKCAACEYTETKAIAKKAHTESEWITVTVATCTDAGKRVKKCTVCETVLKSETVAAHGHVDADRNGKCDNCGEELSTEKCSHICHSSNKLAQFFWKIIRFFCKLFGVKKICACGVKHY